MITAIILVNATIGQVPTVARALAEVPGVVETYSVAGDYDIVAIVRVKEHEEFAGLVTERIGRISGITKTVTLIAFQYFPSSLMERAWSIGMEEEAGEKK
ncbi:MAG: Lrp/AsnC ligand binding domain-containing protein [Candidatus Latescibacteria bacterium]|nr:Lrp/AsnC ligand binding domain-containing protein [Candidatus Latescibacterota bacterium]